MDVYPIKLTQEAIYVDVGSARAPKSRADRGGAGIRSQSANRTRLAVDGCLTLVLAVLLSLIDVLRCKMLWDMAWWLYVLL